MTSKTLETNSIPIPPHLAGLLKQALGRTGTGFDEGAFLQQLHYWTSNSATKGWIVDGVKWIYNSLKSWQQQFPWMSEYGLRKAIANLKRLGLIQTAQHWITNYKRVMFYRIDYERLKTFTGNMCSSITTPCVNSDQLDVQTDRTTNTDITSYTSLSEQQTVAISTVDKVFEEGNSLKVQGDNQAPERKEIPEGTTITPASSGNSFLIQDVKFPGLIDAVAEAIAHPAGSALPVALKRAIAQFPNRVKSAIAYLKQRQRQHHIKNPVGYLHQAIVKGWNLQVESSSVLPKGFNEWFDQMKHHGLVVAATTIDGIHHTLHAEQGWLPTTQLMEAFAPLSNSPPQTVGSD
ncbi:hypothetical protein ACQ4M4_11435 [Leptolyngbya sp. AN02str]|uniref:hypothetical protein n=1 Tax=Leptolyngbya sp. AN02str TaxID=3423363 RepID=UPI003D312CA9